MVLTIDTVDPKTEENRLGNCNFRKRRQLLKYGVVASVIIILFIVIIVLAARKPTETASASTGDSDCTSAECYSYASQLVESIDSSVDPCDNFYDFACGLWMKNTFVEDSETWNSAVVAAGVKTNKNLREILESPITDSNSAFGKAQRAYQACASLNSTGIIDSANTFTKRLSEKTGGWPIAVGPHWANSTNVQSFDDLLEIIAELRRVKLEGLLFSLSSGHDWYNTSNIIFMISQPSSILLPRDNEGRKSFVDEIVRKAKIVNSSSESFDEKFANQSAWKVIDLIDEVNKMIQSTSKESPLAAYEKLDISTLRSKTGIDWLKFLKNLWKDPFEFHENDIVVVYNLDYFIELSKCVSGNCFEWSSVVDYEVYAAQFQPTDIVRGLYSSVVGKFPNPRVAPRWLECVRLISSWFPYALAHEYVKVYYDYEKDNVVVRYLVDGVFDTFNARILKLDWLTDEDKTNSKLKSDHMKRQYFYSNWVGNAEKVQEYYADLEIGDDAVSNLFAARLFDSDKTLTAIFRNKEEFTEWPVTPLTSNAYYSPQLNSIFINAGILQPPVFGPDRLKAMNYGGLGSIIGHEITHGYDLQGTGFNHLGNVGSWLSEAGKNKFDQNAQCFREQYGRFQLTPVDLPTLTSNVTINANKTLSENIADNGGLQQAFGAYKRWVEEHGPEKVPDVLKHYSAEQIFFISFSQQWCAKYSYSKPLQNTILTAVHSPPKFRVLGSLSNFEEFAKAFHCKSGDVMNPKLKCSLW